MERPTLEQIYGSTSTTVNSARPSLDSIYGGGSQTSSPITQPAPKQGFFQGLGNVITRPFTSIGGGVQNLVRAGASAIGVPESVLGSQQAYTPSVFGGQTDTTGYRDGEELGAMDTTQQLAGNLAEGLSYGIGGGVTGTAAKGIFSRTMPNLIPLAKQGALGGGLALGGQAAASGEDLKTIGTETLKGAAIGAVAAPVIGGITGGLASVAKNKLAPELVDSIIGNNRQFNKSIRLGHDPGASVVKYGVVGNNLEDLTANISKSRNEVGQLIGQAYELPSNVTKIDNYTDILQPLRDDLSKAMVNSKSEKPLINRYKNLIADLEQTDLSKLAPKQAFDLKQQIKRLMKFTGNPTDDAGVNGSLNGVYGKLVAKLNKNVPELAELNKDYGGLISAELAAETALQREAQKAVLISSDTKTGAVIGTAVGLATGGVGFPAIIAGVAGSVLAKLFNNPAVKTRLARFLAGATKAEVQATLRGRTIAEQKIIIDAYNKTMKENGIKRIFQLPIKNGAPTLREELLGKSPVK